MDTASITKTTLGEIRAEMARQDMTQSELAERLGWNRMYLQRRLKRKVPLSLDDVEAIAAVLHIPIWKLTSRSA